MVMHHVRLLLRRGCPRRRMPKLEMLLPHVLRVPRKGGRTATNPRISVPRLPRPPSPRSRHLSMPKYDDVPGVEQPTIVVFFPRCFWLRSLLRRCTMQRHFGYACQASVEFLAPVGMCSMTVAFVIFAGRLIFCLMHDQPPVLECVFHDEICTWHFVATGILGIIYGIGFMCAALCVHACFFRNLEE